MDAHDFEQMQADYLESQGRDFHLTMQLGQIEEAVRSALQDGATHYYVQNGITVDGACSYRGYYYKLALTPVETHERGDLKSLYELLIAIDGSTYAGHKGGAYTMNGATQVHIAHEGETGDAVIGTYVQDDTLYLLSVPDDI